MPFGTPATTTSYTYTPSLQIASVTDTGGNSSSYSYDLLGQKISQADPDSGTTTYSYDGDGNLRSSTDARGKTVSYTYDAMDRKTAEYDTTGGAAQSSSDELASWSYDSISKGYPSGSTVYVGGSAYSQTIVGYDAGGRPEGTKTVIPASEGKLAGTYVHEQFYDTSTGQPITIKDSADGGLPAETNILGYDAFGDPESSIVGTQDYVGNIAYTEFGQPQQYTFGPYKLQLPFAQLTLNYDLQTQAVINAATTLYTGTTLDYTSYTYNPAGEVTSSSDDQGETGTVANETQCFSYNDLQQLTQAWSDTAGVGTQTDSNIGGCNTSTPSGSTIGGPQPYWQSWKYDAEGDRLSETDHDTSGNAANDTTTTYTYPQASTNGSGQSVPAAQPNTLSSTTATTTFGYDADGDTTSISDPGGNQSLTWNDQGQLASDTTSGGTTNYVYDASGNLLLQKDPSSVTLYLPDEQLVLDTSSNTVSGTRFYSVGSTVVGSRTSAGVIDYLIPDRQGTDVLAINASTWAATRREYTPFGQPLGSTPSIWPGDKGFVGGTQDPTTGLENLGAREYDPDTGRFLSLDPILETNDPQQLGGYDYAGNNPVTGEDPTGQMMIGPNGQHCGSPASCEANSGGDNSGGGGGGGCWGPGTEYICSPGKHDPSPGYNDFGPGDSSWGDAPIGGDVARVVYGEPNAEKIIELCDEQLQLQKEERWEGAGLENSWDILLNVCGQHHGLCNRTIENAALQGKDGAHQEMREEAASGESFASALGLDHIYISASICPLVRQSPFAS